jgi:hypothetical protein
MCKKKIVPHFSVVSSFIPASPSTPSPPLHRCWASISFIIVSSCRVVELPQWLEGMVHLRLFKRASYYSSCITNCSTANQPTAYIAKRHYFHLGCYKSDRNFSSMVFSIFSFVQNQQLSLCLPSPPPHHVALLHTPFHVGCKSDLHRFSSLFTFSGFSLSSIPDRRSGRA